MAIKRRKSKHKTRVRASIRNTMIMTLGALILIALFNICANTIFKPSEQQEKTLYKSKETFKQQNRPTLKENQYISIEDIKENQPIVTDFLKEINTNYKFKYEGEGAEKINVVYKVKGTLKSGYIHEGKEEEFWNKDYILLAEKQLSSIGGDIEINEDITIDVEKYNELISDFVDEIQISVSSKLCVIFEANVTAYANNEMITETYNNEMQITLGDKLTNITGKFDEEKENARTSKQEIKKETNMVSVICWTLFAIICGYGLIKMQMNTKSTNRVTNTFKLELNQILSTCGDRIIKVDSNNSIYGDHVIAVRDINELVKLSEETFKPILYYQVPNSKKAWFYIILEKEIYRFILK